MKVILANKSVKTYFIATTAISLLAWEFFFKYGAYGEVHFHYVFSIWIVSVGISLGYLFLPKKLHPFPRVWLIPLVIPSVSLLLSMLAAFFNGFHLLDNVFGVFSVLISLPYICYLLLSLHQEDTMKLPKSLLKYLLLIFLIISAIGYINGRYNYLFMTCHDFQIAGDERPKNCWNAEIK